MPFHGGLTIAHPVAKLYQLKAKQQVSDIVFQPSWRGTTRISTLSATVNNKMYTVHGTGPSNKAAKTVAAAEFLNKYI